MSKRSKIGIRRGENHWQSKLTADDVRLIRELCEIHGLKQGDVAIKFEVAKNTISDVIQRNTWAHVK